MTSNIDVTKPVYGNPTTQSVRDNFLYAHDEISDLQSKTTGAPFLPISGGTMDGVITLKNDPVNPYEAATKRYVDNLAFGVTGGVPEAPVDDMAYARMHVPGGMAWSKTPLFQSVHVGTDSAHDYHRLDSDATYNFWKASTSNDFLRFNRTTNAFELVANNVVIQSWSSTQTAISNLVANNSFTIYGTAPSLYLNSAAASDDYIYFMSNSLNRWSLGCDVGLTGFGIFRYNASGNVVDKPFAIARTDGAVTLGATYKTLLDAKGNVGISFTPPANAGPADVRGGLTNASYSGGWLFGWGFVGQNIGIDAYYTFNPADGNGQWRGLRNNTRGWNIATDATNIIFQPASAITANSGDALTMNTRFVFAPQGQFTMHANTVSDAIVYIDTARTDGYSRYFAANNRRTWSFGADGTNGNFGIFDETASALRFIIDTAGGATFQGAITSNGRIQSEGGRIISHGSNNCSVTCFRDGYAAGMFVGGGDTNLYFASMDGSGNFGTVFAFFNSAGNFITAKNVYFGNGAGINDPVAVTVAQGYQARTRYTVANVTDWSCGCLSNGYFAIANESAGAGAFRIRTGDWATQSLGIGHSFLGGAWQTGSTFTLGWNNMVAGLVTLSIDNGGAAYAIAAGSDSRLKRNIEPTYVDCLDIVEQFQLKRFNWRDMKDNDPWKLLESEELADRPDVRVGLIAQEVNEVFPEGVHQGDDFDDHLGRVWNLDGNVMLALAFGAIKQLNVRFKQLEAQVS